MDKAKIPETLYFLFDRWIENDTYYVAINLIYPSKGAV